MTIFQAAAISKVNNLPIRRDSWPEDKWFWVWLGGHWFSYSGGKPHTVLATDYTKDDLLADDWTTVPASLANCPITPTEPGGGNPPTPGRGGFADESAWFPSSSSIPTAGGDTSLTISPPESGTGVSVTFSGIETVNFEEFAGPGVAHWDLHGADLNGTRTCQPSGPSRWTTTFTAGTFLKSDGSIDHSENWSIVVHVIDAYPHPTFSVTLIGVTAFGSVWNEMEPQEKEKPMTNINESTLVFGGTATVN